MKKQKSGSVWMILPLYIFTLIFVAGPLLYMVALSFAQPKAGHGVEWIFTLDNYRKILDPVYMKTFTGSFQLAVTSTLIICLLGYPFGYFMAKLSDKWKKRAMIFLMLPFWVNSLIRLYGWMIILQTKGLLNHVLKSLGLIEKPLRILYSYPAIVIGTFAVYDPFCIFECRETGLVTCRSSKRSRRKSDEGFLDGVFQTDTSGAFIRGDPDIYSVHGTVFYCRYPRRQQNRPCRKSDSGADDKRK